MTDPVNNAAEADENLIDLANDQQPTHQAVRRLTSIDGAPDSKAKASPADIASSPKATFMPRRTSSITGISVKDGFPKRSETPEMREYLKHLGPSNLASRPRQTRYNTVKIKPGAGIAMGDMSTKKLETSVSPRTLSMSRAAQGGIGEGLISSAGKEAKDGVQAVQVGYGSTDGRPPTPKSPQKTKSDLVNGSSKRPQHSRSGSVHSQSTVASLPDQERRQSRRGVRSGSITENIIEAGGFRKIVLEMTSSSEENDKEAKSGNGDGSHHNGKENHKPGAADQESSGKKKRRRKRKKGGASGEDTPLLERDEQG